MSERTIENARQYNLDPKEVIAGLNGYYESDKRNGYITVRRNDVEGPAYFTAALYLSALIEWLRVDHDIFYYPGMDILDSGEAGMEAKKEDVWKNVMNCIRQEPSQNGFDLPRACQDLIEDLKKREVEIKELKERITLLETDLKKAKMEKEKFLIEVADREEEIESLQNKDYDVYLEHRQYIIKGIMCNIRQDASRNGFALPEKVDGEPLSIERTFHDLIELLMKRTAEVKEARKKHWNDLRDIHKALGRDGTCDSIDGFAKAVKARAEHVESLSRNAERETQKSDTNKLIREYCTKHDVIAPSRYLSDEACVEYLFSIIDQKDRSSVILRDLYRDIFKKRSDGLSAEDVANRILDRVLTTEDLLHKSVDSVNKECKAVGRMMVADYEKDLLNFIYKAYKDRTHLSDETITYNPPSVRNTITKIISDYTRNRTRVDILEGRIKSIFDKYKTKFTVDDYVINSDPTTSFMLDCIGSWISSPAESRGKIRAEIENYKLKLKDYILRDINEHGYRYDGLETKSIEEIVDWIITMETCDRSSIALRDIYTTVASPVERLRHNIDDCDGAIVDHMKDYILRRFEGFNSNTEYCLKKMAELDGCQKDLKILEEQQKWLIQQNSELATKVSTKDDEISRLKGLINEINKEEDGK